MAWTVSGNLKGPKGDTGTTGAKGDTGTAGAGVSIAGTVATYAALPSGLGPSDNGKGYLVSADGKLYVWDGTAFPANGAGANFQGPQGAQGPQGDQGPQGIQGQQGVKGDTGNTGADGAKGDQGNAGATGTAGAAGTNGAKWFTGSGAPGSVAGSAAGDKYLDVVSGDVYSLS